MPQPLSKEVQSFGTDLMRTVRLSKLLCMACEELESNDETPSNIASATITLRKAATDILNRLKKLSPKSGQLIEEEMNGELMKDRLWLIDATSDVVNLEEIIRIIEHSKEQVKKLKSEIE